MTDSSSLVLQVFAVIHALISVAHLIADDYFACDYLLIDLPILQHLQVYTYASRQNIMFSLDGTD